MIKIFYIVAINLMVTKSFGCLVSEHGGKKDPGNFRLTDMEELPYIPSCLFLLIPGDKKGHKPFFPSKKILESGLLAAILKAKKHRLER